MEWGFGDGADALIADEEEGLVADDGAPNGRAELILFEGVDREGRWEEVVAGVECVIRRSSSRFGL